MGCHGPHLLQGELDASRPYLGGCRLKPLDHKDGRGVSDLHPCALPHAKGIPTEHDGEAAPGRVEVFNTRRSPHRSQLARRMRRQER
ncbi:hypothetical protein F9278_07870 [Streptomyces phaeolivaceus]|uniref:Uncharacterized protein n=1 Tax=Streptomyces phaeolivaceus TaxID=2653200 RepID=A0A5P8JZ28_9ACTN|nr:hypothetical protein F9278_07870 [Streptomyces phaeolivaceus]